MISGQLKVTLLRTEIIESLKDAILKGDLMPGERLNERVLAERFGVSRPPLREAIRQLESEGLVVSIDRRGSYVRTFTEEDVKEIYLLRYALELAAAEFVAEQESSAKFELLERRLEEMEEAISQGVQAAIEADFRLHRELVRAAGLRRLLDTWEQLVRELRLALVFVDPEFFEKAFVEDTHRPLLDAIRKKDFHGIRRYTDELRRVGDALGSRWEEMHASASTRGKREKRE